MSLNNIPEYVQTKAIVNHMLGSMTPAEASQEVKDVCAELFQTMKKIVPLALVQTLIEVGTEERGMASFRDFLEIGSRNLGEYYVRSAPNNPAEERDVTIVVFTAYAVYEFMKEAFNE